MVDPAYAPGTGTPEPGGPSAHDALTIVRGLTGIDFVGFDVVEVIPAYDPADLTAFLAANLAFEMMSLVALYRRRISPRADDPARIDPSTPAQESRMNAVQTTPQATSSTLYFGPWYRRSPFFENTLEAGCSAYDIYNHMYLPGYYADPIEEYWALLNDVTVWDVSVERIVEITGPRRQRVHELADLSRPDEVRRRPGQVHARDGRGRRHRQRPGPAARRGGPLVDGAGRLGCRAVGARRGHPLRP